MVEEFALVSIIVDDGHHATAIQAGAVLPVAV